MKRAGNITGGRCWKARALACAAALLYSFSGAFSQETSSRVSRMVSDGHARFQEKSKKIDQELIQSEQETGKRMDALLCEGMSNGGKAGRLDIARAYYRVKTLFEQGVLDAAACRKHLEEKEASDVMDLAGKLQNREAERRRKSSELNRETYEYADSFVKKARLLKGNKALKPLEFAELIDFRDRYDLPPGAVIPAKGQRIGKLKCTLYTGNFSRLEDMVSQGKLHSVFSVSSVGLPWGVPEDGYGLVQEGSYYAEEAGEVEFALSSDDGSRLSVAGRVVILNDGLHAAREVTGKAHLRQGWNPIKVEYFEQKLEEALSLKVKDKTGKFVDIPSRFFASEIPVESVDKKEPDELDEPDDWTHIIE